MIFSSDKRLGHDMLCIGARREGSENDNHVELVPCDSDDLWDYDPRLAQLQHLPTGQCLKVTRYINIQSMMGHDMCLNIADIH